VISIYNSYAPRYTYVRTGGRRRVDKPHGRPIQQRADDRCEKPQNPAPVEGPFPSGLIPKGILPAGIDISDLMLGAVLLLLYLDSKDEEFLIILAVVALSVLKPESKK